MPAHMRDGTIDEAALIDGAVLVNAPFGAALAALHGRPAQREVDRRFVYIDPHPHQVQRPEAVRQHAAQFNWDDAAAAYLALYRRLQVH